MTLLQSNKLRQRENKPLYIQVSEELKEEIVGGVFAQDDKLPSIKDLAEQLGISISTLREAINILERGGLVKRLHGIGTIITRSPIPLKSGQDRLRSFTEVIQERGMEPGTSFTHFAWEEADEELAQTLQAPKGSKVAVVERVRTGDGRPMIYAIDKIPESVVGDDFHIEKIGQSLFQYLRGEKGVTFKYSNLEIRAVSVDNKIAGYLDLKENSPVLSFEDVIYDIKQTPVLYSINIYRTDRHYFEMKRWF